MYMLTRILLILSIIILVIGVYTARRKERTERGQQETRVKRTSHHPLLGRISPKTTPVLPPTSIDSRTPAGGSSSRPPPMDVCIYV